MTGASVLPLRRRRGGGVDARWWLDPARVLVAAGMPPDPWQHRLLTAPAHRTLIAASRQTGKSTVVSGLSLRRAACGASVLVVSPTQRQSSEMLSRVRALSAAGPARVVAESALSLRLACGGRVLALPGVPTAVRGYTADLVVIDEAAYVDDATYRALRPTLAATGGDLVALSTPGGRRGWFYRAWHPEASGADVEALDEEPEDWRKVAVTWRDNPRLSPAFVAEERRELGAALFRQEYECEFVASEGALLDPDLLELVTRHDSGTYRDGSAVPEYARALHEQISGTAAA